MVNSLPLRLADSNKTIKISNHRKINLRTADKPLGGVCPLVTSNKILFKLLYNQR